MIKPLRRRHLQVWSLLAILLPATIMAGWLAIPRAATDFLLQSEAPPPLPLLLAQSDKPGRTVSLRASADTSTLQLEWIERSPLTTPTALVYAGQALLGRIGPQGTYRFSFRPTPNGKHPPITVYDIIHHQLIEKINF
jgi:hypothetical protein